jgi:hypothetical protein
MLRSQLCDGVEAEKRRSGEAEKRRSGAYGKVMPVDANLTGVRGKSRGDDRSKSDVRAGNARIIVGGPFSTLPVKSRGATRE